MTSSGIVSSVENVRNGVSSVPSTLSPPSSLHLDDGGMLSGLNDFEEIGLADEDAYERGRSGRLPTQMGNSAGLNSLRDLTHAQSKLRPTFSNIQTNISTQQGDHLAAPDRKSKTKKKKQQLGSQSTPSLVRASSRQRSPAAPIGRSASSNILQHATGMPGVSPYGPKRASWQRKTSDQLEEEYDSDDDVPPDTIFYNVPLSPRSSRAFSASTSPERVSGEVEGEKNKSAPPTPKQLPADAEGPPPLHVPRLDPDTRSKSWTDLSDEAKELTEALERHAGKEEKKAEQRPPVPKAAPVSRNPSLDKTVINELPPLQISDGIIDPLPISKEKEAVLSRTRPSWLPPKSKEEEKRHLKEYQKMMRRSHDAERKRAEKERLELEAREKSTIEHSNVWEKWVIPNWDVASRQLDTRELWWKGVSLRCRGTVWKKAFGNHLSVSSETYRLALKRARELEASIKKAPTMHSNKDKDLFVSIQRDVMKAYPDLKIFQVGPEDKERQDLAADSTPGQQEKGPLHEHLENVLLAYSMYRNDVGYVYGTHVVAGMLLFNLPADQAFIALANILNRPLPLAFFTQDEGAISRSYSLFLKAFQYKLPSLFNHMNNNLAIPPMAYLEPMFLTLFTLHCPVDIASRIWDVYCFEGDAFLVRTAVAVLTVLESKLYGSRDEILDILGWGAPVWELGKEDEFMDIVRSAGKEETKGGPGTDQF